MKRRVLSSMIALTLCLNLCPVWAFAAGEGTDGGLCPHHPAHTDECGYVPESPDALCTFACRICPVEDLIGKLPDSVSEDNREQVQAQLSEIYALYDGLTAGEQQQVDLSPCRSLQDQLDGMGSAALDDESDESDENNESGESSESGESNESDESDESDESGEGDDLGDSLSPDHFYVLTEDFDHPDPFEVSSLLEFNTNGYTYTGTGSTAIQVNGEGKLYLAGTVISSNGVGAEILSDGFLSITEPGTSITGKTYALDIASGAEVRLSAGRYVGKGTAIRTADGDLAALLEPGYAYFDGNGNLLLPADAAGAKVIVIGPCPGHLGKTYTHTPGATTHTWSCPYCVMEETEPCTFAFGQNEDAACDSCENTITIVVDAGDLTKLVYDGTMKLENVSIKVTLTDGSNKELVKDADYEMDYTPHKDAGEITVTVTGITFNGTFTKTYHVEQAHPGIEWDHTTCAVNYDSNGLPVDSASLPPITITGNANGEDLHPYLQYFYRKVGDTEFTEGLPTSAGTYEVKAYIPESQNYKEAETNPYLTLTISKIPAVTTAPTAKTLTYSREAQKLVTAGVLKPGAAAEGAKIEFKLGTDGTYSTDIPTGIGVSNYNVYYRVSDTENYSGVLETLIKNPDTRYASARINHKDIKPTVELEYDTTLYTNEDKRPGVTVKDGEAEIPNSEYSVEYSNNRKVGTATVTVKNKSNGNYNIITAAATFTITLLKQDTLSIVTDKPSGVYYGDTFRLSATGGSGSGAIQWSIVERDIASIDSNGSVKVTGTGGFTVQAYRAAAGSYGASNTASVSFVANPKPVTPIVTADDKPYDGKTDASLSAKWKDGDLVTGDTISLAVTGEFVTTDVGLNKKVTIRSHEAIGAAAAKYTITWPDTTTASIYKVDAKLETEPKPADLTYNKNAQPLLTGGTTVGNIGKIVYSTSQNGAYSTDIPTGTKVGLYTVWYKVADSVNYTGIPAVAVEVEIAKADPNITSNSLSIDTEGHPLSEISLEDVVSADVGGTFAWMDDSATVESGKSYGVIFTPEDKDNYNTVIVQVQVAEPPEPEQPEPEPPEAEQPDPGNSTNSTPASRPGTSSAVTNTLSTPIQTSQTATTVRNGTASTVISAADGSRLVQGAVANKSRNVVIKPEITGDVTKTEVSIPSSTVSRLGSETDAALTVSSPVADVTIPNAALGTLSQAGGTVNVVTEQVEQAVVLTVAAGGETVEEVPGGLTLTVPVEDAGPGTVAVLVHDDGTRETVRKSVAGDGVMNIPLSGSATVEIVDNSKDFDDVPPESWAADAVDFASSHELFSGTSETTFSPDLAMSRGMLATVLYRLEGSPDQDLSDVFNGVSSGAWYEEGVAWAAENGIAGGYGDGQFGPDDDITREQFVVMLWRYAGSPEAGSQVLDFVDADQVSSFALEALCWAVENGILHGVGNGVLDPGGTATRAQAAQLLKNFMEST